MKPQIVVLEDALSGFEDATQVILFEALARELPSATIITVGGASALAQHHTRRIMLVRDDAGSVQLVERDMTRFETRRRPSSADVEKLTIGEKHD